VIEDLLWADDNEAKLEEHGIGRAEVVEMVESLNYIMFESRYTAQVRVTGFTSANRWLTIAMEEYSEGVFRPITGWAATRRERQRFVQAEQGLE
jgi:uncharacterized DUF497 family protein